MHLTLSADVTRFRIDSFGTKMEIPLLWPSQYHNNNNNNRIKPPAERKMWVFKKQRNPTLAIDLFNYEYEPKGCQII